ncbi:hypothetical protein [Actinocrispum wychmicini]|uniref:Uncharacterized protein n=1 Tax=Actinocrispum wychmicini TaxID=1213861 RepID=A0A4R2J4C5_9PSEU|nr:hypothetical protein [Actinocrispum wychmicini]TCO53513.1 hypothetical protein EV192_110102 [Actinocrispum wychmicini]
MSTSRKPEPGHVHETAEFLGDQFAEARRACGEVVQKHQLVRYLAHYSQGAFDFSYAAHDIESHDRSAMQRLGRQLGFTMSALDRRLQEARTGALIRTVLHTEYGAVMCGSVVPRQNVVGLCVDRTAVDHPGAPLSDAPEVRTMDKALSDLTTHMRARISLPSLNPGGWASADVVGVLTSTDPAGAPRAEVADEFADPRIVDACVGVVRPEDLQFVAYCTAGEVAVMADHFDHPSLAPFFTQISVEARRTFYRMFSRELGGVITRLNHTVGTAEPGGLLVRVVLDVEQGAIYFYRLAVGTYLVGVTIDQARVRGADERIARLAVECAPG